MPTSADCREMFCISDGTAITCETVGHAVLSQFPFTFSKKVYPYIESEAKLAEVVEQINRSYTNTGEKPLVFFSLSIPELKQQLLDAPGHCYDVLDRHLEAVQADLNCEPIPYLQRSRAVDHNSTQYFDRISAIEYTLAHDDGISLKDLDQADVILLGVSRSGKTPTSIYMAMQFGLRVVNYPFIFDDMQHLRLLPEFEIFRHKLFGLTIDVERLSDIRNNRFSTSQYASLEQCRIEASAVESLFRFEAIPYLNTTNLSVEEISARVVELTGLKRR